MAIADFLVTAGTLIFFEYYTHLQNMFAHEFLVYCKHLVFELFVSQWYSIIFMIYNLHM